MIYIITGEDIVSSRKKLSELIEGNLDITRIDGEKNSISEVLDAIAANSLFSQKRTVVIGYFSKIKPLEKFFDELTKFAKDQDTDIILWDEEIDTKKLPKLKSIKSFSFSFPKYYYQFLDSFFPALQDSTKLLHEVLKTLSSEQVLYGLVRRIRQLLVMKSGNIESFSEFKRMQSWQIGKLRRQANLWSESQLKKAFSDFVELDEKIKTGALTMPLSKHLDILLLSDLN